MIAFLALATPMSVQAKDLTRFFLRGNVRDKDRQGVDSLRVSLFTADSVPVPFKLLTGDPKSNINLKSEVRLIVDRGMGDYRLVLEKEGFEPIVKDFKIGSVGEEIKVLGWMTMHKVRDVVELQEQVVTATRVKLVMKGDTLVYDAAAFQLSQGSMLEDLVKQLPGATLEDGVIKVNGRPINDLLLNGKDFFKGNSQIALKNLPSYTIKDIKVYDKAPEDAYLTHSNAKIATREEDKNLVLSVQLKKEYNIGYNVNVHGAVGTENRYDSRLFGMGFTDKWRLSAFTNLGNGQQLGDGRSQGSGFNYTYNDKKLEVSGNVNHGFNRNNSLSISSATKFYNTGDLYTRSLSQNRNENIDISTNHNLRYKGESVFLNFRPSFSWKRSNSNDLSLNATFKANPDETYRGEALDSLFSSYGNASSFYKYLLTQLKTHTLNSNESINGSISSDFTVRPKHMKGVLRFRLNGGISRSDNESDRIYLQGLGPENKTGKPTRSDRYTLRKPESENFSASSSYNHNINKFTDKTVHHLNLSANAGYSFRTNRNDNTLYVLNLLEEMAGYDLLPSLRIQDGSEIDRGNSTIESTTNNDLNGKINIGYNQEPIAPGDSTFNASFGIHFTLEDKFLHNTLSYRKLEWADPRNVVQNENQLIPSTGFSLNSNNEIRSLSSSINLSTSAGIPSIYSLLKDNISNSNPLHISVSNPDLRQNRDFSASFNLMRIGKSNHRPSLSTNIDWRVRTNAIANASTYDPATGVTRSMPVNVNGNWNINHSTNYNVQFGERQQLEIGGNYSLGFNNSVDYIAIDSEPTRSEVRNYNLSPQIHSVYRFANGSNISLRGSVGKNIATSPRPGFTTISSTDYNAGCNTHVELPSNIKINSNFSMHARRGFSDKSMNTTEWLWNADIQKSMLKNGALTIKLSATDILQSVKSIHVGVNAQGRTETWRNTIPRYLLLSASYRFSVNPKMGKKDGKEKKRDIRNGH